MDMREQVIENKQANIVRLGQSIGNSFVLFRFPAKIGAIRE